jgi:glycosyltransferase involved in cell wall biosynthesis
VPRPITILGAVSHPFPALGGAHLTHLALLRRLRDDFGHTVHSLGGAPYRARTRVAGLTTRSYRDLEELRQAVLACRPDVLVSSLDASYACARVARRYGVPHLVLAHSFEECPPTPGECRRWGLPDEPAYPSPAASRELVRGADQVLACSRFLRDRLAARHRVRPRTLYPEFVPGDFLLSTRRAGGPFIASVCGRPSKGAETFLELARRFPRERFLLAGALAPALRARVDAAPNVTLLPFGPIRRLLELSRIVLVPSRWPEPFGRIAVEAMANGIPVLASRTGGLREIVGKSPLGVRAFREPDAWESRLAGLLGSPAARALNAELGRRRAARFLRGASTRHVDRMVRGLVSERRPSFTGRRVVALRGAVGLPTAFSIVNGHWHGRLRADPRVTLVTPGRPRAATPLVDVTIDHDVLRDFKTLTGPEEGRLAAVRFWDFGPYPPAWARLIVERCDRLLVHSRWVARQAVAAGVPRSRVSVVPLGIDPAVFRPAGPRWPIPTTKPFRFLFVGAPVLRKGIDVLLDAWGQAFTRADPVCLVIKTNPVDPVYGDREHLARARALAQDPAAPEVVLIDRYFRPPDLAALYRACQVGVFPYRAEGFCMPILEAMACGLPALVPRFGACLDFCSDRTSYLMPVRRVRVPFGRVVAINSRGFRDDVAAVDFCEVEVSTLVEFLRRAPGLTGADRADRGRQGARRAHARFTWGHSVQALGRELDALAAGGVPVRIRRARTEMERRRRALAAAWALYQGR